MTGKTIVQVHPDRFVTVGLFATISGYTANAIRMKIHKGVWIEGREYRRAPDGHILIDRDGVQRWVKRGA